MEIMVQGIGNGNFIPNEVSLNINFHVKSESYESVLELGVNNVQSFISEILLKNGFTIDDMKTKSFVIREEKKYDESTRTYIFDGFSFNQSANIKFDYNRELVASIMSQISSLDNAPTYNISFGLSNLEDCKKQLLTMAYEDAMLKAQIISDAAGKCLNRCIKVDFKPLNYEYVSETNLEGFMKADYVTNSIVNTFTPEDIELSETLYCLWLAE